MTAWLFILLMVIGPIAIFVFARKGWGLVKPAIACLVLGSIGITLFVVGLADVTPEQAQNEDVPPLALAGFLLAVCGIFGTVFLAVVLIARWVGGEYKNIKTGDVK